VDSDRDLLANLVLARGVVDRAAEHRADAQWQAARRADPRSQVLTVTQGSTMVRTDTGGAIGIDFAPSAGLAEDADLTFLGVDVDDVAYFARHVDSQDDAVPSNGAEWVDLRVSAANLNSRDAGLMVTAVALDNWLHTHVRCPRCGELTTFSAAGWSRRCPNDGSEHFPRTDPAVIMLVRDRDDRALLGRQAVWAEGWFSTLAGFVESGESAEAAVRREIREESGVIVGDGPDDLRYLGSQPWPFPCSLMLGYHAWTDDPTIDVDGDEIEEARWFSRAELVAACENGEVRLPGSVSIARRLIERWYGAELPGEWSRPVAPAPR
jgi:NAD+ diphosphatase